MGVEWSDDLDASFASEHFFDSDLLRVVKDAFELHWLHRPFLLELLHVFCLGPDVSALIVRGDIDWLLGKAGSSSVHFEVLVVLKSILVFSARVHEN